MNSPPTTSCMCVLVTFMGKKTVEIKAPRTAPDRKSDKLVSSGDDRNCGGRPSRIRSLGRHNTSSISQIKISEKDHFLIIKARKMSKNTDQ